MEKRPNESCHLSDGEFPPAVARNGDSKVENSPPDSLHDEKMIYIHKITDVPCQVKLNIINI